MRDALVAKTAADPHLKQNALTEATGKQRSKQRRSTPYTSQLPLTCQQQNFRCNDNQRKHPGTRWNLISSAQAAPKTGSTHIDAIQRLKTKASCSKKQKQVFQY